MQLQSLKSIKKLKSYTRLKCLIRVDIPVLSVKGRSTVLYFVIMVKLSCWAHCVCESVIARLDILWHLFHILYKIDKTKILMTNGSLMKVKKGIAECSPWSILQYF